tara:strand:- start:576 stop:1001 length:426 start_codon:yes stop_codon:yes gene_type:complete
MSLTEWDSYLNSLEESSPNLRGVLSIVMVSRCPRLHGYEESYEHVCMCLLRAVIELTKGEQKEFFKNWKRICEHPKLTNAEFYQGLIPVLEKTLEKEPFFLLNHFREAHKGEQSGWLYTDGYGWCPACNQLTGPRPARSWE